MRRVFRFQPDTDRYELLVSDADDALATKHALADGRPLPVARRQFDCETGAFAGDFPTLGARVPVLSEKAYTALSALLDGWCGAQEIFAGGRRYFALSVRHRVDCLDRERSDDKLATGLRGSKDRIELHPDKLTDAPLFLIEHIEAYGVFTSGEFMDIVVKQRLRGLKKLLVWPKAWPLRSSLVPAGSARRPRRACRRRR